MPNIPKEKDILTVKPELVKEWSDKKNGPLLPGMFSYGSKKKVWWECNNGHEWQAKINNRSNGSKCPYCSGRRVLSGYNDIATTRPDIAKQWDYSRNGSLTPAMVSGGSTIKVWWKCDKGHIWEAAIYSRFYGRGCPECAKEKVKTRSRVILGENDLATMAPDMIKEWDYEKNGDLKPELVAWKSMRKVWWKCVKGHEYQSSLANRTSGHGCPYCSGKRVIRGVNDLQTIKPDLVKEWDYKKNKLKPYEVAAFSGKRMWWRCEYGHEWQVAVNTRSSHGNGCPYCSNQKILKGYNDLTTTDPQIAVQWDYRKNGSLKPEMYSRGSGKSVWWQCEKGHEWKSKIGMRVVRGNGCPYCSNNRILHGFNDLKTTDPKLIEEWDYEKNKSITPDSFTRGSSKKVWWKCYRGHEWKATIVSRVNGSGCPKCSRISTSLPEYSVYYYLKQNFEAEWRYRVLGVELDVYIPKYRIGIEYDGLKWHSDENAIRKEKKKNEFCESENIKLFRIKESDKNQVAGTIIYYKWNPDYTELGSAIEKLFDLIYKETGILVDKEIINFQNDRTMILAEFGEQLERPTNSVENNPELLSQWNYEKNKNLKPYMLSLGSSVKVWWVCEYGHEWQANINSRARGNGCPYCSGRLVLPGINDLKTTHPDLIEEWNFDKNKELTPDSFSFGSNRKVWWKCKKGHEWTAIILNRTQKDSGCPYCMGKKILPGENDLFTLYPSLKAKWNYERNTTLKTESLPSHSPLRVWWKCQYGHEWRMSISHMVSGVGCPYCEGRKPIKGENDFATQYPELLKEWDYTRNTGIIPQTLGVRSSKKVWWRCKNGHEWQASIGRRTKGAKCPFCSGKKILPGENDLFTTKPEIVLEWNYKKNINIDPNKISPNSNLKVWWRCSKGHEWEASINNRVGKGSGCPYCSGNRVVEGENDLATLRPDLMNEWLYRKNISVNPHKISIRSHYKVWWKCKCGHEWESRIADRTQGHNCPICSKNNSYI